MRGESRVLLLPRLPSHSSFCVVITLHFESFLAGLETLGDRATVLRDYMQTDGIHPNAAGVELIVEAMGPSVLELIERIE